MKGKISFPMPHAVINGKAVFDMEGEPNLGRFFSKAFQYGL